MNSFPNFPSFLLPRENPHFEAKGTHCNMCTYSVLIPSRELYGAYHDEIYVTSPIHTQLEKYFGHFFIANET